MAISTCGLPASGGPCKRSPGHGGLCFSGVMPISPPPNGKTNIFLATTEIFSDIAAEYLMQTGLRRLKKHAIFAITTIVVFAWIQFGFDLYILFR